MCVCLGVLRATWGRSRTCHGSSRGRGRGPEGPNRERGGASATFECNICLETAREAVVSVCGHLYCWPCLHQWLETRPDRQECPVCKAGISREKVVPLYGRGSQKPQDPRLKTPPRPQGQRPAPESRGGSSHSVMQGDFTSPLVLAPSPLASLPPCSMPTSLSEGVQVWIWGRVTQPPAGKIPCSCSSPSFSFLAAQYLSRISSLPTSS